MGSSRWGSGYIAKSRKVVACWPRPISAELAAKLEREWSAIRGRVNQTNGGLSRSLTPRSVPKIVAHNLKLAADIDHMRDGTSNAPAEPRPPPVVP